MKLYSLISLTFFGIGLVGGVFCDQRPQRPEVWREGYRVLEGDFHAHTRFSDGFLSPFDLVIQAQRRHLDVLAITEHNMVFPSKMGRWFSKQIGGPTILIGEEITTNRFHVHGIGLSTKVDASQSLHNVIRDIHQQGGLVIAAHPVKRFWGSLVPAQEHIDAAELMHPLAYGSRSDEQWKWEQMLEYHELAERTHHRLTAIGASDYHFFSILGLCRTLIFSKSDREYDVLQALKEGRTVVYDLQGRVYGHPEHVHALAKAPYSFESHDYNYKGLNLLDRICRILGFLGFLGFFLVKRL